MGSPDARGSTAAAESAEAAIRRATDAWRALAPAGPRPEALRRHGARVWLLLAPEVDARSSRALAPAHPPSSPT